VEAELFHADGRTKVTKLTVAFRNFANAPKSGRWIMSYDHSTAFLHGLQFKHKDNFTSFISYGTPVL